MKNTRLKNQIEFFEKLGNMLNSGVPLQESLRILQAEMAQAGEIQREISSLLDRIDALTGEANLFQEYPSQTFGLSTTAMLSAGEKHGQLDYVCIKIANCLRAELNNLG